MRVELEQERPRDATRVPRACTADREPDPDKFDDGWLLVRASSNLPALVMVAEAQTADRLEELYRVLREGLDRFDEVDKNWSNDPWAEKSA